MQRFKGFKFIGVLKDSEGEILGYRIKSEVNDTLYDVSEEDILATEVVKIPNNLKEIIFKEENGVFTDGSSTEELDIEKQPKLYVTTLFKEYLEAKQDELTNMNREVEVIAETIEEVKDALSDARKFVGQYDITDEDVRVLENHIPELYKKDSELKNKVIKISTDIENVMSYLD